MKVNIKMITFTALLSILLVAGCSKNNDIKTNQNNHPITLKNIGTMHNQILDLYYSKHVFRAKESVSLKDKIAIVDEYYKEHNITPLFSTIVKQDTNLVYHLKQITSNSYQFTTNYKINDLYNRHIYSKAEYTFMKRFYDSIQPNLSNPVAVLKIIGNFENELQNSSNYLKVEKEQLESVMCLLPNHRFNTGHMGTALLNPVLQQSMNCPHGLNAILAVPLLQLRI